MVPPVLPLQFGIPGAMELVVIVLIFVVILVVFFVFLFFVVVFVLLFLFFLLVVVLLVLIFVIVVFVVIVVATRRCGLVEDRDQSELFVGVLVGIHAFRLPLEIILHALYVDPDRWGEGAGCWARAGMEGRGSLCIMIGGGWVNSQSEKSDFPFPGCGVNAKRLRMLRALLLPELPGVIYL